MKALMKSANSPFVLALIVATAALGGCAVQRPGPPPGLEQKIETATSRSDHEDIATQYERQASNDAEAAKRHYGYAATYRKNISPRSGIASNENLAKHCEALARTYEQAAEQNRALARLHRAQP